MSTNELDVIVVGAGHAGIEAAHAAARLGAKTLLLTNNIQRIGFMSCNPSIGGLGKGHIVKEIDILGGLMGFVADETCLQFKRLNGSRGPAVRGTRMQCDKDLYCDAMSAKANVTENLSLLEGEVSRLILENDQCVGVITELGEKIFSKAVVITTGTFLRAVMHFGLQQIPGGRVGDRASVGISDQLKEFGFSVARLKTGTPARIDANSVDWSKTTPQSGDSNYVPFSLRSEKKLKQKQIDCYITHTSAKTHEIIRANLHQSPMYCGVIEGIGPRYCPSIEDKITRFADKERHQSFLEPEGLSTNSIYVQGMSTSLPESVQYEFLRTMDGLENVKILKPGYAVEYDYVEPNQLQHSLETRNIKNLYLAGQINGTSGYEEAAGQGLVAGVNASLKIFEKDEFILGRDEAYIGVLIDDLVTKGTKEPYRMMTSRAEHRLILREDNALERLGQRAISIGLVTGELKAQYDRILSERAALQGELKVKKVVPNQVTQDKLRALGMPVLQKQNSLEDLLRREEISCSHLYDFGLEAKFDYDTVVEPVEISIKYSGYISRQLGLIEQARRMDHLKIPNDMNYSLVKGLSREEVEKLSRIRPISLGQASRVSGVNPSALQAILVFLKGHRNSDNVIEPSTSLGE